MKYSGDGVLYSRTSDIDFDTFAPNLASVFIFKIDDLSEKL